MTTEQLMQIAGILLEIVFIPIFVWLGRTLMSLHIDVQGLLKGFHDLQVRMDKMDTFEHRLTKVEVEIEGMTQ